MWIDLDLKVAISVILCLTIDRLMLNEVNMLDNAVTNYYLQNKSRTNSWTKTLCPDLWYLKFDLHDPVADPPSWSQ